MKRFLLLVPATILFIISNCSYSAIPKMDLALNDLVYLRDPEKTQEKMGAINQMMDFQADYPFIYLISIDNEQYAKLFFYPGDTPNTISLIEIGYVDNSILSDLHKIQVEDTFRTDSGLYLGMSEEDLKRKKGDPTREDGQYYHYQWDETFVLSHFNTPDYSEVVRFSKDRKVDYIRFGFDYP